MARKTNPVHVTWTAALSAAALLVWIGGCAASRTVETGGHLSASARPYAVDIPVPVGFGLVDEAAEDWSSGPVRYVRHRYVGRADKYAVRKFYSEQMPLVRWTIVSDGNVHGRIVMRFGRGAESCTVTIEDEAVGFAQRVAVEVIITPSAR